MTGLISIFKFNAHFKIGKIISRDKDGGGTEGCWAFVCRYSLVQGAGMGSQI